MTDNTTNQETEIKEVKQEVGATEEVKKVTEEVVQEVPSMDEFKEELNDSFAKVYQGDIIEGTIITITDNELLVNIGYISDGIIPLSETLIDAETSLKDVYKTGDKVKAEILKKDDGEGNVLLSIKKAEQVLVWDELETAFTEGTPLQVTVKQDVKGGVTCDIKGVRAFIPASLLSVAYVEDLKVYVGKTLTVKVVDFNKEDKKVILSRKVIEQEERAEKKKEQLNTLQKNDRLTGKVTKLMKFGAFVDIGGLDGLIHNNDLSWSRVKHPSEVVKEGDTVDVYVIDVDKEKGKVALGLKDVNDDPWGTISDKFSVGGIYEGEVVRLTNFGAFVRIAPLIEGLVHVSQISEKRIENPEDVLAVGDQVKVKIVDIDKEGKKLRLSIKEALADADKVELDKYKSEEQATTSLKDVFKGILKDLK